VSAEVRVTVLGPGGSSTRDLVLRSTVPVVQLVPEIALKMGLSVSAGYLLRDKSGRVIGTDGTLRAAGVDDGDILTVEPGRNRAAAGEVRGRSAWPARAGLPDFNPAGYRVLPTYLVVDTSASMWGKPIGDINAEIPRLYTKLQLAPALAEVCQISIVTFDEHATVHTPLTDIDKADRPQPLEALGDATNYERVFTLLREQIIEDLYELHRQGRQPYRPAVFFLSDGCPNEGGDWQVPLAELTNRSTFHGAPSIIAFGFGDAEADIIRAIGKKASYLPAEGSPSARLDSFMVFLLSSLSRSVGNTSPTDKDDILEIPSDAPPGWRPLHIP